MSGTNGRAGPGARFIHVLARAEAGLPVSAEQVAALPDPFSAWAKAAAGGGQGDALGGLLRALTEEVAAVDPNEAPPAAAVGPRIYGAEELLAMTFPEAKDVVPGMVPEGLSLLVGRAKLGKSLLALQWAISVASGGHLLGTEHLVTPGGVAYLDLENGPRRAQKRLRELLGEQGATGLVRRLDVAVDWPRTDAGGGEALRDYLGAHPGTRLIVVDTLKRVRARERGNAGRLYDLDYDALAPLADLAHDTPGLGILVIHHSRKGDASDVLDLASGSTGLTAAVDAVLVWRRARSRPDGKLFVTDRDRGEVQQQLTWDALVGGWRWTGTVAPEEGDESGGSPERPAGPSPSEERSAVVTLLAEVGRPLAPVEIGASLHRNGNAVRVLLWRMAQSGEVVRATRREGEDGGEETGSFYTVPTADTENPR